MKYMHFRASCSFAALAEIMESYGVDAEDYSIASEVHVDMYDDRLVIWSPGGMPDGSLVQNLDLENVVSKRRNPVIADMFGRLDFMERRGSGFKKILEDYRFEENFSENKTPVFRSDPYSFSVTLYNLNYEVGDGNVGNRVGNDGNHVGNDSEHNLESDILKLIHSDCHISAAEIARRLNRTTRTIERYMKNLREEGKLVRHGTT